MSTDSTTGNSPDTGTDPFDPATASRQEIMATFLADDLVDGEILQIGAAMPVGEVAVRLAHMTHGPNMELIFIGARMNVAHLDVLPTPEFGWDRRTVRWAESFSDTGHRFDRVKDWHRRVFFIGGVQVDAYGNQQEQSREFQQEDLPVEPVRDAAGRPLMITVPIAGIDDAIRSVELIFGAVADAIADARREAPVREEAEEGES